MRRFHGSNHHRKPSSKGGQTNERNISHVSTKRHQAWHTLFYNLDPEEIASIINRVWLDPDYEFICRKKV